MQNMLRAGAVVVLIAGALAGFGPSPVQAQSESGVPASGFYAGAGVSANLLVPTSQSMFSQGISNVFQSDTLVATGAAGGPSLTRTEIKLNNVVGFANINGAPGTSITGAPTSYSSSQWLVGATLAAGATYFLTPSWFIDLGYAFTLTDLWNTTCASPFTNTASGFNTVGVLSGSYTGGLNTHAVTVSINRRF